jgi:16S rRNA (guanine527-N7)-methyltransferase
VSVPSAELLAALERARRLGVLGPVPVEDHVAHARGFLESLGPVPAGSTVVDLGSGGGVPGLVIVEARPDLQVVLLDAMAKRTALLTEAVVALEAADRCRVVTGRAEDLGRSPELRGMAGAVTARLFGPPAVTAECAAPLLREGGRLLVSEPPDAPPRWPEDRLRELGMRPADQVVPGVCVLEQTELCPDRYPRRNGVPAKRPLF